MRYDIIADTHGYLSPELLRELSGADVIVHAGDLCSVEDLSRLERIARVYLCKGNNDGIYSYGPAVRPLVRFESDGLRWQLCHYEERLDLLTCDVAICGHTHRPFARRDSRSGTLVMNPGSPTYPRAGGPTMGRIFARDGEVLVSEIVSLSRG